MISPPSGAVGVTAGVTVTSAVGSDVGTSSSAAAEEGKARNTIMAIPTTGTMIKRWYKDMPLLDQDEPL
jgi:hypothetical protein